MIQPPQKGETRRSEVPQTSSSHLQTIKELLFSTAKPRGFQRIHGKPSPRATSPAFVYSDFGAFPSLSTQHDPETPLFVGVSPIPAAPATPGMRRQRLFIVQIQPGFQVFLNKGLKQGGICVRSPSWTLLTLFSCTNICKHVENSCPAGFGTLHKTRDLLQTGWESFPSSRCL